MRLGSREFEELTQSLAIKHFGPGVEIFGEGPDGGREATFEGKADLGPGAQSDGSGYPGEALLDSPRHRRVQDWFIGHLKKGCGVGEAQLAP